MSLSSELPTKPQALSSPSVTAQSVLSDYVIMHEIVSYFNCPWVKDSYSDDEVEQQKDLLNIALLSPYTSDIALRVLWKGSEIGLSHIFSVINFNLEGEEDKYLAINEHSKKPNNLILKSPIPEAIQQRARTYLSYIHYLTVDPYNPLERNLWSILSAVLQSSILLPHLQSLTLKTYVTEDKPSLSPVALLLSPSLKTLYYGFHVFFDEWEAAMIHSTLRGYGAELETLIYSANKGGISSILVQHLIRPITKSFTFKLNDGFMLLDTETFHDILQPLSLAKSLTCLKIDLERFQDTDLLRRQFSCRDKPQLQFKSLRELYLSCDDRYLDNHEFIKRLHCPSLLVLEVVVTRLSSWTSLFDSVTHFSDLRRLRFSSSQSEQQDLRITDITTMTPKSLLVLEIVALESQMTSEDIKNLVIALPRLHTLLYFGERDSRRITNERWYQVKKNNFSKIPVGKRTVNVYAPSTLKVDTTSSS